MNRKTAEGSRQAGRGKHGFLRGLLHFFGVLLIIAFVCAAIGAIDTLYYRTHYKINFYQETSIKVSGNIRIAIVSDIHNREYGERNEALLSDLHALKPDLILFPGDMVIREQDEYQSMLDLVSKAAAIAP